MDAETPQISIHRLYLKDLSFESPQTPALFRGEFRPEIKIDVSVHHQTLEGGMFEVSLEITATGTQDSKKVFVVEVEQAGLFLIQGLPAEQLTHALRVFCPNILFPYARQAVDSAMNQGSLPGLMLPQFDFESVMKNVPKPN